MTSLIYYLALFVLSGCRRELAVYGNRETPEVPYHDESCSNVQGCYCYLTGEEYQADCAEPGLVQIPPDLSYNITVLYMTGTLLYELASDDLLPYPDLKVVNLASNKLSTVQSGSLDALPALERFVVSANRLSSLPPDVVLQNSRLTHFDASDNVLDQVPEYVDLSSLEEIRLAYNKISTISGSPFSGCSSLRVLDLKHNEIGGISEQSLSGIENLESLDLSSNKIRELIPSTFAHLGQLKVMALGDNSLTFLSANSFSGADRLLSLDLSQNNIYHLADDSFAGLSSLQVLQLSGNNLTSVPDQAFRNLTSLRTLYLRGNRLVQIREAAFSRIASLTELFLDGMPTLRQIEPDSFRDLPNLERLSLANNPNLLEFDPDLLPVDDVPKIQTIYLYGNGFVYLDQAIFDDKPELQLVDLFDNKFNCSCDLKWMTRVVHDKVRWASHWSTSSTPPECYTPHHLRDWPIPTMTEEDMTCELLEIVPVSPDEQTTHLKGAVNMSVYLYKGLPSSFWIAPDEEILIPYPAGEHPLNLRRFASWALVDNNTIKSTLFINNASLGDQGSYRVFAINIAGSKTATFDLEVLPYEFTTTTIFWQTTDVTSAATSRTFSWIMSSLFVFNFVHS